MAKPEKISKKCPLCKGTKVLPKSVTDNLPKPPPPGKKIKCTHCRGRGFVFAPPNK